MNDIKVIESKKVITRFPPSPTGFIHIGNVRSNLFAWLAARKSGGSVVLRIEDTDQKREIPGAIEFIKDNLSALGLNWDSYAVQSERLEIYEKWATKLYQSGNAYSEDVTEEEVDAWREDAKSKKMPFLFRNYITDDRIVPWVYGKNSLRLKSSPKRHTWIDEVRGELTAGEEAVDDLVVMKSDGIPPYGFAHIVDDYEMGITHIFRSDEFISSTPKYLNIYEALDIPRPKFVTCPPVMAPTGNKKLSKRDGAKSIAEYISEGYLPDALLNFLALLGWNPGTTQEIFTREELIQAFDIKHIGKSGARYDVDRLNWISGHHIRNLELDELYKKIKENSRFALDYPKTAELLAANLDTPINESSVMLPPKSEEGATNSLAQNIITPAIIAYQKKVLSLFQERLKVMSELPELTSYFFVRPVITLQDFKNDKQTSELTKQQIEDTLNLVVESIKTAKFAAAELEPIIRELCGKQELKPAQFFSVIRVALTNQAQTPKLFDIMEVLGKDETLERLNLKI